MPEANPELPCASTLTQVPILFLRADFSCQETKGGHMAQILKVIEVLAESEKSWEDAAAEAVKRAAKTVKNIRSIYIENFEAKVEGDRVVLYRVNGKISFVLE
jgi:dodecin